MPTQINIAAIFLVKTLSNLVLIVFILRLLLQWARMDFYNPLSQFVFRATNPLVAPLQRIVPRSRAIDLPGAIVVIVLTAAVNLLLLALYGASYPPLMHAYFVFARIVHLVVLIYLVGIIVVAVLSWFGQPGYHPVARVLSELVSPILSRFRRFLPPFEGIDFSPLAAILGLYVIRILVWLPPALL